MLHARHFPARSTYVARIASNHLTTCFVTCFGPDALGDKYDMSLTRTEIVP